MKPWYIGAILLSWVPLLGAQSLVERLDRNSWVDWASLTLHVTGNSALVSSERTERMEALERARLAAEQNLAQAVGKINYDGERRVQDRIRSDAELAAGLRNVVRKFTIVDTRSLSDMSVELDIVLSLKNDVLALLLPRKTGQGQLTVSDTPLCPTCGQPWPEGKPVPRGVTLIIPSQGYTQADGKPFTGLVIDARGLELKPAISPAVRNQSGTSIYGIEFVAREAAVGDGVVGYHRDLERALQDPRIGPAPLVVRALEAAGKLKSTAVISDYDALLIHAAALASDFLKQARVIVVTDL